MSYAEYAYSQPSEGCAHSYLLPAVKAAIGAPSGPILDLGCGNGWIARALMDDGHEVYGVDASASGIALANQQRPGHFFVTDIQRQELPAAIAGKRFDTVLSTEVIEHLYDPRGFLDLARKVLSPGGRLILSTPYHGYLKDLAMAVVGKHEFHRTVLWDGGHIKFFSRRTLEQMLRDQGFTPTGFAGAGRLPFLWKSMLISAIR